jgi:hypothetical protein
MPSAADASEDRSLAEDDGVGEDLEPLGPTLPTREERPLALAGAFGWNTLGGWGATLSYSPDPHVSLDAAVGLSIVGFKMGGRVRYNVLTTPWTPSLGLGIQYGGGTGGERVRVDHADGRGEMTIEGSPFAQILAAMSYQGPEGMWFLGGLGYSILLVDENVTYVSGPQAATDLLRSLAGSGMVIELGVGYAF